jgi:hypothetical protein
LIIDKVLTAVVREDGGVSSSEIESTSLGVSDENGCPGVTLVEVKPFLGLDRYPRQSQFQG